MKIHKILVAEYLAGIPGGTWRDAVEVVPSDGVISNILIREGLKVDPKNHYAPVFRNRPGRVVVDGRWIEHTPESNFREYAR